MAMGSANKDGDYSPSYRERDIDKTLDDHEMRITKNERRWLTAKGALGTLVAIKGVDLGISQLIGFI